MAPVVWAVLALLATISATEFDAVIHSDGVASVCRGETVTSVCTTRTTKGFLSWLNGSNHIEFNGAASVNASGTLGSMTMILNSIKNVSDVIVYTSTASGNIIENTTLTCSNGKDEPSIDIIIKSPSSPLWAYSACRFSQGNVRWSWNPPIVAPECCDNYTVQLSTSNELFSSNTTNSNVSIGAQPVTATVHCIDHLGDNTTSQNIIIDSSTTLEVTIVPLNSSCDTNSTYDISWTTSPPSEGVCTPPITMSTITCTTSSTHQSSNNTRSMICSVPATEIITAIVTITNAAGFNTSQSASADTLAQTCERLNRCSSRPQPPRLRPAEVAAIIMGLFVFLLTVVCIVLAVYIVRNRTIRIKQPLKDPYPVNLKAVNKTAQEKESRTEE